MLESDNVACFIDLPHCSGCCIDTLSGSSCNSCATYASKPFRVVTLFAKAGNVVVLFCSSCFLDLFVCLTSIQFVCWLVGWLCLICLFEFVSFCFVLFQSILFQI